MPRQAFAAACLVGAALLVIVAGSPAVRPGRRLRWLGRSSEGGAERTRPFWWPDRVRLGAGLAGVAAAIVVGGWAGLLVGVLVAVAADRLLRRIEPRAARDRRLREIADLPLAADLLAAALRAGAPVDRSVLAVAEALGGPMADRLGRVGRTLLLGGEPAEAWSQLLPVPGAERLVAAALRSSNSGAALAGALTRLADDLRADRSTAAEAAARRAGVLIVLPLGLCFLPAFILAGLVPVIVAVLGDVL
ncbi:type II secretion system F family protein [Micromonospora inositola]|uniref:Type II secretion system (T2SS), protein F n=1 Tax=Micromonospora inositola TaxID=47865 RepID=A0A1C5HKU6_9ACTN|nr:type II secretion system F family protein [Micromonospora inositola]SCG46626.1 Type II secretion system (T2SS), protein F [Micromonospora inositola]